MTEAFRSFAVAVIVAMLVGSAPAQVPEGPRTLPTAVPLPPVPPLPKEGVAPPSGASTPLSLTPGSADANTPMRPPASIPGGSAQGGSAAGGTASSGSTSSGTSAGASTPGSGGGGSITSSIWKGLTRDPAPNTATAFNPTQRATLERINAYFNSISTLVGKFVQIGPDGRRSEGEFYLQKPGRVRFDYHPPNPVELIADGSSVAVRDRKLATQDIYPLGQTPLRFLLADRIDLLKDSNVVAVYQDELFVTVIIEEKHLVAGTHRLMIMFDAKDFQLKQWTVTDPQGFDTTIAVSNLDPSKKPDPALFRINYERMIQ